MSIVEKIIEWRTAQIAEGRSPEKIALSPWDEAELDTWAASVAIYDVTTPRWERRIFGMEIVSSDAPPMATHG